MKLVFFATGGAVPSADDGNVSFALRLAEASLLVDASGNPVQSLLRSEIDPLALHGVVLTHAHTDHLYGLPSLLHATWLLGRREPLSVYCDAETAQQARALCDVLGLFAKPRMFPVRWISGAELEAPLPGRAVLRLFPVLHSVPTCGLAVAEARRRLVYSADTGPCERIVTEAAGAEALIHEASATADHEASLNAAGHCSGRQAAEAARQADVARLFLCHFDRKLAAPQAVAEEAAAAYSGEVVIPAPFTAYEI